MQHRHDKAIKKLPSCQQNSAETVNGVISQSFKKRKKSTANSEDMGSFTKHLLLPGYTMLDEK